MKYSKVILVLALVFNIGSCTKDFEEMNTSPNSPTDVPAVNVFTHVIIASVTEELGDWIQHTYLGCWSQQWCKIQYIDEDKYQTRDMTGEMESSYTNALLDLQLIINKTTEDIEAEKEVPKNTALKAASKIMRVWIFSYLTDLFGDIPYSGALQGLVKDGVIPSAYDTQESIYTDFFSELDEANTLLSSGVINFGAGDLLFGGDPASWRKFGNSLKLRLLNRCAGTPWSFTYDMVGTQPDVPISAGAAAFSGADAAIASLLGGAIMASGADDAKLVYPGLPYRNPIFNTLYSRDDQAISQTMVEFLKVRNDPRLPIYAQPTPSSVTAGTPDWVGEQNGRAHAGSNFSQISMLGTAVAYDENAPLFLLTYDEVEFIKAEHFLRVSNDAAAKTAYEAGIAASMARWGATYDPVTYLAQANVDWAQATTPGEKYQLICEQRWASIFGQGVQAFNLVRRTGFPERVFEYELYGGYYPDKGLPVRIRYSLNEEIYNAVNLAAAQTSQGLNLLDETMFNTAGSKSNQVWWNTREHPIPIEVDTSSREIAPWNPPTK